jgi:hypothetical protein
VVVMVLSTVLRSVFHWLSRIAPPLSRYPCLSWGCSSSYFALGFEDAGEFEGPALDL